MTDRIAVIGLGYVGLPVALALAEKFPGTIGFDINPARVKALSSGTDTTGEIERDALLASSLQITANLESLKPCNFFVVAVPTPIDRDRRPNLTPLIEASKTVGSILKPGDVVVYESTVYPGVTEEICGPILAQASNLQQGIDFKLGYSPERINPGDTEHTLAKITKVVAGEDPTSQYRIANVYRQIITAGIHQAPSIKVAEAAKVIENTQRDLNIALMNELAIIFDRMGIRTHDVLAAAQTKWNFLPFTPGLVGGHCIGVDPYYLTTKAEQLGYSPEVILAGRQINDRMGTYLAQRLIKLLVQKAEVPLREIKIGVLGLTFKENVSDLRNSRVPDIIAELKQFGIHPLVHDPLADVSTAHEEYGITLVDWSEISNLDGLVLAVCHQQYLEQLPLPLLNCLKPGGVLMDVKSAVDPTTVPSQIAYWSL